MEIHGTWRTSQLHFKSKTGTRKQLWLGGLLSWAVDLWRKRPRCLTLRRRGWEQDVKVERRCTHMVKEPGGADTRRRSAACTWWMLEAAGNEQRRQSQQDSVDRQGPSRGEKERHTKFKQKLNEHVTNSEWKKKENQASHGSNPEKPVIR